MARSHFVGAAGQYFVCYGLSVRQLSASLTLGNAPGVDILVSDNGGLSSMTFQVKTSRNAYRTNRYGREGYEWDVGVSVIGKQSPSFWYAFVDLQETETGWDPQVFFVPSKWVAEFVKPDWARYMYFLPTTAVEICHNKWSYATDFLAGSQRIYDLANSWPEDKLVRWGT